MNWLLPEHLSDALPLEAAHVETLRRAVLDRFRVHGYELVMPPLLEYLESLLTGAGQDLNLRTCKLVDQLSGRSMGVRADMTPQVARIDAHLLNRQGVTRLCYCDSVLHALPATATASREPIQLGAELYGYAGIAADIEIIRLMAVVLDLAMLPATRIELGHSGIFRALSAAADLSPALEEEAFGLLQGKDVPGLQAACAGLASPYREALLALPELYGDASTLARARRRLPALPAVIAALDNLQLILDALSDLPCSVDLADLRGYHYHNGVVFAAYCGGYPSALALGGRYDGVGAAFGRARPATGFSLDLRELTRLGRRPEVCGAILAPCAGDNPLLAATIADLRARGAVVVELLPGESACEGPRCDRKLVCSDGRWLLESIGED
jgi:ATP phosphoribosyltransferase regulatory subunit